MRRGQRTAAGPPEAGARSASPTASAAEGAFSSRRLSEDHGGSGPGKAAGRVRRPPGGESSGRCFWRLAAPGELDAPAWARPHTLQKRGRSLSSSQTTVWLGWGSGSLLCAGRACVFPCAWGGVGVNGTAAPSFLRELISGDDRCCSSVRTPAAEANWLMF